jgi:hypothetical protein
LTPSAGSLPRESTGNSRGRRLEGTRRGRNNPSGAEPKPPFLPVIRYVFGALALMALLALIAAVILELFF